ncbi:DUF7693 family protein [Pseudomonas capeferrum]|uniref:DUF7693 family protein n=1 Tax=Pseudomonas capeferrum TaxID=1495066 RepID=UPI001C61301C|nr:hypothetical protein [Pseudomonas capeferrum]
MNSRDVYQRLRDAALGVSPLILRQRQADVIEVAIDDWHLSLAWDCEGLAYCLGAVSPEGRSAGLEDWHRYDTDPVSLLSLWERAQIERLLARA